MRMSSVIELLLVLLLLAFAAYGRVIDHNEVSGTQQRKIRASSGGKQSLELSTMSLKQATDTVNRYCTCNENICNCCRDFHIPLVQLKGPGCASLQYLQGDNLAVQLSFGDNILTSTIVNGKSPKPVCVPLPGGYSKFCGRIYSIQRDAKNHFKACLGLELQSSTELEASLRVSCFRFGPDGLKLRPAEPLPIVEEEVTSDEDDDDDDDDDLFGLGSDEDDEDDDDDEDEKPTGNNVPDTAPTGDAEDEDDDDDDVLGLGALLDIITGDDELTTKKPKVTTAAPLLQFTIPLLTRPTTPAPLEPHEPLLTGIDDTFSAELPSASENDEEESGTSENHAAQLPEEDDLTAPALFPEQTGESSNKVSYIVKPDESSTSKPKKPAVADKKKPAASASLNAIKDYIKGNKKKPAPIKPVKPEEDDDDDFLGDDVLGDDNDDDDDDGLLGDDDDDDDDDEDDDERDENDEEYSGEDDESEHHQNDEDEKAESLDALDDDDDEEEDAMISALVGDDKETGKNDAVGAASSSSDEDDADYALGLTELLAGKRHAKSARQSRVMRL